MTPEQEQYINAILGKSEEDLLYEIASGGLQGVILPSKINLPNCGHV